MSKNTDRIPVVKVVATAEQELGALQSIISAFEGIPDEGTKHRVLWYLWDRMGRPSLSSY